MSEVIYREDVDQAYQRLTEWWKGGDIGRPVLLLRAPRDSILVLDEMPEPEGWTCRYSTMNFDYRLDLSRRDGDWTGYFAEAIPCTAPALGTNCLAMYLGCEVMEDKRCTWCNPCISDPEHARFEYDPDNFYWDFTLRLAAEQLKIGGNKIVEFPDLVEGLDTLAAMRGTEILLMDLFDRPEWVHGCLKKITSLYFRYYDILYDMIKDESGGSHYWMWAPGRMSKFQCDLSYMISPDMFNDFMVPVLTEMTGRVDYCIYHWDGMGALPHHDLLLGIDGIDVLQWNPGAGHEPIDHPRWWPLYHKTLDAGKRVLILCRDLDSLKALKKEFGKDLNRFAIWMNAKTENAVRETIDAAMT